MIKTISYQTFVVALLFLLGATTAFAFTNTESIDLESSSSQYLTVADNASLSNLGDFTFEAWVKLESVPSSGNVYSILSKWNGGCGDQCNEYYMLYENNSTEGFRLYGGWNGSGAAPTSEWSYSVNFAADQWYHVAVACDVSAPSCKVYINGEEYDGVMRLTGATDTRDTATNFAIGSHSASSASYTFDGLIDEVRVWNDLRSASEIENNMASSLTGSETNLQGYWRLNDDLIDETANSNDLTNNGSANFSDEPGHLISCSVDSSALFSGSFDQLISCSIKIF